MFKKIFKELKSIANEKEIEKHSLLILLKDLIKNISIFDQMNVTNQLRENLKEVQGAYQEEVLEIYVKHFVMRIKDIKEDKYNYPDELFNKTEYLESIDLFEKQEQANEGDLDDEKFRIIYIAISLYTTFILEEPIHPVGSPFPGGLKVELKEGVYYCPVKENNKDNPKAVCRFCIAEQLPH